MICEIEAASSASAGLLARKSGSAIEIAWIFVRMGWLRIARARPTPANAAMPAALPMHTAPQRVSALSPCRLYPRRNVGILADGPGHVWRGVKRYLSRIFRVFWTAVDTDEFGSGGEGGIRTPDTVARMPHFECGAFDHSATSPH